MLPDFVKLDIFKKNKIINLSKKQKKTLNLVESQIFQIENACPISFKCYVCKVFIWIFSKVLNDFSQIQTGHEWERLQHGCIKQVSLSTMQVADFIYCSNKINLIRARRLDGATLQLLLLSLPFEAFMAGLKLGEVVFIQEKSSMQLQLADFCKFPS